MGETPFVRRSLLLGLHFYDEGGAICRRQILPAVGRQGVILTHLDELLRRLHRQLVIVKRGKADGLFFTLTALPIHGPNSGRHGNPSFSSKRSLDKPSSRTACHQDRRLLTDLPLGEKLFTLILLIETPF